MPDRGKRPSTEACRMPSPDRHPHRAPAEGGSSHEVLHAERLKGELRRGGDPFQSHAVLCHPLSGCAVTKRGLGWQLVMRSIRRVDRHFTHHMESSNSGSNTDTVAEESDTFAVLEMEDLLDLDALWDAQTSVAANRAAGLKVCPALVKHRHA